MMNPPPKKSDAPGNFLDSEDRIAIRVRNGIKLIGVSDIDWVEAARHYVRLHCGDTEYLVRGPFSRFVDRLGSGFMRVSRSAAVQTCRIEMVVRRGAVRSVRLQNGVAVAVSRTHWMGTLERIRSA